MKKEGEERVESEEDEEEQNQEEKVEDCDVTSHEVVEF